MTSIKSADKKRVKKVSSKSVIKTDTGRDVQVLVNSQKFKKDNGKNIALIQASTKTFCKKVKDLFAIYEIEVKTHVTFGFEIDSKFDLIKRVRANDPLIFSYEANCSKAFNDVVNKFIAEIKNDVDYCGKVFLEIFLERSQQ